MPAFCILLLAMDYVVILNDKQQSMDGKKETVQNVDFLAEAVISDNIWVEKSISSHT